MSAREDILAAIRSSKPALNAPAPTVPSYDDGYPTDRDALIALFADRLQTMGGQWHQPVRDQNTTAALNDLLVDPGLVCSTVPEYEGQYHIDETTTPDDLAKIDTAILRARFGVAETGTVCFTEVELVCNPVAYLAQHLVVLLNPAEIITNLHRAYQRRDFLEARYTVFHTGPSATADIEGVLVRGAQGVRSLTVMRMPRPGVRS